MKTNGVRNLKAVALIFYCASAFAANSEDKSSQWGKIGIEHLVWNGKEGSADGVEFATSTLSLHLKRADLQRLNSGQNHYQLALSKGIELTSEPSALHNLLPLGAKARWTFEIPHAEIEWNRNRKWQSAKLSKMSLKGQMPSDLVKGQEEKRPGLTALSFCAERIFLTRAWQVLIDRWKISGRLHSRSSPLDEFTCSADQIRGDLLAQKMLITPHTTFELPCGKIEHRGPVALSSMALHQGATLSKLDNIRLSGSGTTTGELTRLSPLQSIHFNWPLGFEFDTLRKKLCFFGQIENRASLTVSEKARSLHLFAEKGDLSKTAQEDGHKQLCAQFFNKVELFCKDGDGQMAKSNGPEHQIWADRLTCYWPKRQLIFSSLRDGLVRYSSGAKQLNISAPSLKIDCPSNSSMRVHGEGTVFAKLKGPQKLLLPLAPLFKNG